MKIEPGPRNKTGIEIISDHAMPEGMLMFLPSCVPGDDAKIVWVVHVCGYKFPVRVADVMKMSREGKIVIIDGIKK